MLKILIFSPSLKAVSGVSTHVNMIKNSILREKFEFIHFQVGSEGRKEAAYGKILRFIFSPIYLAIKILIVRPDIVHINTSMDKKAFWRDFSYFLVAKTLNCNIVNQVHSGSDPSSLFTKKVPKFLLRKFLTRSKNVVVLSNETHSSYKIFDNKINVFLIPNAIVPALIQEERKVNFEQRIKLAYVGRIVREKGIFDVLAALKLLKDDGVKFSMLIAGTGPAENEVKNSIKDLGMGEEITFLGPVLGLEKDRLWITSDIHLFPTYFNEGLPYSILESMAAGCVPITCPIAAIPDVIEDQVHGLFVPQKNPNGLAAAIRNLDADRIKLQKMSEAGCKRIQDFYLSDRLAEQLEAAYNNALTD